MINFQLTLNSEPFTRFIWDVQLKLISGFICSYHLQSISIMIYEKLSDYKISIKEEKGRNDI